MISALEIRIIGAYKHSVPLRISFLLFSLALSPSVYWLLHVSCNTTAAFGYATEHDSQSIRHMISIYMSKGYPFPPPPVGWLWTIAMCSLRSKTCAGHHSGEGRMCTQRLSNSQPKSNPNTKRRLNFKFCGPGLCN